MNPIQLLQSMMASGGMKNPQQMIMNMVGKNNPMITNLMQMANKGDSKGVEKIARNLFKEKRKRF